MNTDCIRNAIADLDYAADIISGVWAKTSRDYEFVRELRSSARAAREELKKLKREPDRPEVLSTDICHNTGISGGCGPDCEAYEPGKCDG